MVRMIRVDGRRKIGGHWYNPSADWYASKKEAQQRADQLRQTGRYKSVRIVARLADRRYKQYYVYTR